MAGPVASNSPTPRWTTRLLWTLYLAGHLRGQAHFAFRRLTAVRRIQARRVRRMISFAYSHVPYYRDTMQRIGLKPENVRTADDLARLPIIELHEVGRLTFGAAYLDDLAVLVRMPDAVAVDADPVADRRLHVRTSSLRAVPTGW